MSLGLPKRFEDLSLESAELINQICRRFEAALKGHRTPQLEDYLSLMAEPGRSLLLCELLKLELDYHRSEVEQPTPQHYYGRFPGHETMIDTVFAGALAMSWQPKPGERFGKYLLLSEVAQGGMGIVFIARDCELNCDVAIKMPWPGAELHPEFRRRFIEEAQVTSQLQHPAIPSVHGCGQLADGRLFYAMQLVRGRTLTALLKERADLSHDRQGLLAIFKDVCRALAYAHSCGVIHRDLKPDNVMVGAFDEVQVMDWGLAKFVRRDRASSEEMSRTKVPGHKAIRIAPSDQEDGGSRPGTVLGTPAYMSPEQARGEVNRVDERSDVFSLGAILCEILTGRPPYAGSTREEIRAQAARGDLSDALSRLDECGADAELIDLARNCLAADPAGRLGDAGDVADAIADYQRGVEERLEADKQAMVKAQTKAEEEHKKRWLALSLAAAVVIGLGVTGIGAFWIWQQVQRDIRLVEFDLARAEQLRDAARDATADRIDLALWDRAREAADVAKAHITALLRVTYASRVRSRADVIITEAAAAHEDQELLALLAAIRTTKANPRYNVSFFPWDIDVPAAYRRAFGDHGIVLGADTFAADLRALAKGRWPGRSQGRPEPVVVQLASFLDDWSVVVRRREDPADRPLAARLTALARAADPDPQRGALRDALAEADVKARRAALHDLAAEAAGATAPTLTLLAATLREVGDAQAAIAVLEPARFRHRADPWIFHELGLALLTVRRPRRDDALRAFTAAYTLQPELGFELAMGLRDTGRTLEAIAVLENLIVHRPDAFYFLQLGHMQGSRGMREAAAISVGRSISLTRKRLVSHPDDAALHLELGAALTAMGDQDGAIGECREAIRLRPDFAVAHMALGNALWERRKYYEAIAECREAIRLRPDFAAAHNSLGRALVKVEGWKGAIAAYREAIRLQPDDATVYSNLGAALRGSRRPYEAIEAYHEAIRLRPDFNLAYFNLGNVLAEVRKFDEAIAAYREAIRLSPDLTKAHYHLGNVLAEVGRLNEAIAEYREAIRLSPKFAEAHNNLGTALSERGDFEEAVSELRQAIRLNPNTPLFHATLGLVLRKQNRFDEAITSFRRACDLAANNPTLKDQFARDLRETESRAAVRPDPSATTDARMPLRGAGGGQRSAPSLPAHPLRSEEAEVYTQRGFTLRKSGNLPGAVEAFREAVRLSPKEAVVYNNLGSALAESKKPREAVQAFREAIRLKPEYVGAHINLGNAMCELQQPVEAAAQYREAIRLSPNDPRAYCFLGHVLQSLNQFGKALSAFERGHELGSRQPGWSYPSARWVEACRRLVEQDAKLSATLKGKAEPVDAAERLALAQHGYLKRHYAAAARLFAAAFAERPTLAHDPTSDRCYLAACCAALAAAGQGEASPPPRDDDRARWRHQALDWLRTDLNILKTRAQSLVGENGIPMPIALKGWKTDPDLASLRDEAALAALPETDRKAFRSLWTEVDRLIKTAEGRTVLVD